MPLACDMMCIDQFRLLTLFGRVKQLRYSYSAYIAAAYLSVACVNCVWYSNQFMFRKILGDEPVIIIIRQEILVWPTLP